MTRMVFGPDDDDEFRATLERLVEEYSQWLRANRDPNDHDLAETARIFLDWRWAYSTGELDTYQIGDLHEFLVEWCPRRLAAPPETVADVARSVVGFIEFMAATDRLEGGAAAAARLMVTAEELVPAAVEAMADPANFGMGKSMFGTFPDPDSFDSADDLQAFLDEKMAEFNALPFEERKALTDPGFERAPRLEELPFMHVRPLDDDVEASAAAAPVLALFERLRDHLGEKGVPLTDTGNLRLADARELVDLLDTGDVVDPDVFGRVVRTTSSSELRGLSLLVTWAIEARAIRVVTGRMLPMKVWAGGPPVARAAQAFDAFLRLGPLMTRDGATTVVGALDEFLDERVLLWLTLLLPSGAELPFDGIVAMTIEMAEMELDPDDAEFLLDKMAGTLDRRLVTLLDLLVTSGVIEWVDREPVRSEYGGRSWVGGTVRLTPFGHHVVPKYVDRVGFTLRSTGDLTAASAPDLLDAVATSALDPADLAPRWRIELDDAERARQLVDAVVGASSAAARLGGFKLLRMLDRDDEVAPLVRELLDTPLAGHAALFLLESGVGDADDISAFLDEAPLIDILSTLVDEPDILCQMFERASVAGNGEELLSAMWRHPAPETLPVLEAIGKHCSDKRLAKAARKAVVQHRSWLANPDR